MSGALLHVDGLARAIGPMAAARVILQRALGVATPLETKVKRGNAIGQRIVVRPSESDLFVASQIFGWEDYKLDAGIVAALQRAAGQWAHEGVTPVILDGGANVGYSSLYFAKSYPNATVLAVEPDRETFSQLQLNTRGLTNVKCVHGALWSDDGGVELVHAAEGSWATNTVAGDADARLTPSFRIDQICGQIPNSRILILKLDIEGAERQACNASLEFVRSTPCVIVEPHDFLNNGSGALSPMFAAFAGRDVDTYIKGENLIFVDSKLMRRKSAH